MQVEVEVAFVGAAVTVASWYVTRLRDDRTRRLETTIKHMQRQIEELYGPLFSLVRQIFVANHIHFELTQAQGHLTDEEKQRAHDYFQENYFIPLHTEILEILKTKLYLIDGAVVPESFYLYQKHANQERIQRALWVNQRTDTSYLPGVDWPDDFYPDIERSLKNVMELYERAVQSLR